MQAIGNARKCPLQMEILEERVVLNNTITYNAASHVLMIDGSSASDTAIVSPGKNKISVTLDHPGSTLPSQFLSVTGPVSLIKFVGHEGNAYFRNDTDIPCQAQGGSGDSILIGGDGNDILCGGRGNNQLYGRGGADTLYGGAGTNQLYGGAGNDMLFGGAGNNSLCGGAGFNLDFAGNGINRFLVESSNDYVIGQTSKDARINFVGFVGTEMMDTEKIVGTHTGWTDAEVKSVDFALGQIQQRTGNTRLLKMPDGSALTFRREGHATDPNSLLLGWNSLDGKITLLDYAFTDTAWLHRTIYHEIGHNWEDSSVNKSWDRFTDLSGWAYGDPPASALTTYTHAPETEAYWWYLKGTAFARDYGRTNPWEDWATSVEAYFAQSYTHETDAGANLAPAKINVVNDFLTSKST